MLDKNQIGNKGVENLAEVLLNHPVTTYDLIFSIIYLFSFCHGRVSLILDLEIIKLMMKVLNIWLFL
jgi:hypothetical protein